jgi:hypothetical protein
LQLLSELAFKSGHDAKKSRALFPAIIGDYVFIKKADQCKIRVNPHFAHGVKAELLAS